MATRKIKFRAWNHERMVYNCAIQNSLVINHRDLFYQAEQETNYPIMQYTGLKDKNGKEIYEGDILKVLNYIDKVVIEFSGGQFVGKNTNKNHPIQETQNRNWFQWEIIGNIYQNPELLK